MKIKIDDEEVLTLPQTQKYLRISKSGIYNWLNRKIKPIKIGRYVFYKKDDLNKYIDKRTKH